MEIERRKDPKRIAQDDIYFAALRAYRRMSQLEPLTKEEQMKISQMLQNAINQYTPFK